MCMIFCFRCEYPPILTERPRTQHRTLTSHHRRHTRTPDRPHERPRVKRGPQRTRLKTRTRTSHMVPPRRSEGADPAVHTHVRAHTHAPPATHAHHPHRPRPDRPRDSTRAAAVHVATPPSSGLHARAKRRRHPSSQRLIAPHRASRRRARIVAPNRSCRADAARSESTICTATAAWAQAAARRPSPARRPRAAGP